MSYKIKKGKLVLLPVAPRCDLEPVSAANSGTGRDELYFIINGERVASRGHPGTPQAGQWVINETWAKRTA